MPNSESDRLDYEEADDEYRASFVVTKILKNAAEVINEAIRQENALQTRWEISYREEMGSIIYFYPKNSCGSLPTPQDVCEAETLAQKIIGGIKGITLSPADYENLDTTLPRGLLGTIYFEMVLDYSQNS